MVGENMKDSNDKNKKEIKKKPLKKFLKILLLITILIIIILIYSRFVGTKGLVVKEYKIKNPVFSDNLYGLKIVQLSDIHYGITTDNKDLEKIVTTINKLKPDIVVMTGDLNSTDLSKEQLKELTTNLKNINATINKYAVKGNHDVSFDYWDSIIKDSNFVDLDNNYDLIYNSKGESILIAGINTENNTKESMKTINEYLETSTSQPSYKILLLHKPDTILDFDYSKYNLILAGHSHNGQIKFPIIGSIYLPKGAKTYHESYYKLNNTELFVSSGIGTSILKLRLFNRPSINLYRLVEK